MALQKIFRSSTPSFKFFFKNGVAAIFINGKYTTDQKDLEDELMEEVGAIGQGKSKNPFIYVDEKEPELDTEALSPLELIKAQAYEQARADLLAEMAAQNARALNASANISTTDQGGFTSSLNNTAVQAASMGTDVTLQALPVTTPVDPVDPVVAAAATAPVTAGSMAARLANLIPKKD